MSPENEPISAEEADTILTEAIEPYLADGWHVLERGIASVRLTRGMKNLDVRVDLLGQVTAEDAPLTSLQESGRLTAWMILLAMLLVALAVSSALGIL